MLRPIKLAEKWVHGQKQQAAILYGEYDDINSVIR